MKRFLIIPIILISALFGPSAFGQSGDEAIFRHSFSLYSNGWDVSGALANIRLMFSVATMAANEDLD